MSHRITIHSVTCDICGHRDIWEWSKETNAPTAVEEITKHSFGAKWGSAFFDLCDGCYEQLRIARDNGWPAKGEKL